MARDVFDLFVKETMDRGFEEMVGHYGKPSFPGEGGGTSLPEEDILYIAVACSDVDAPLSEKALLSGYLHPVLGGAASFQGERGVGWRFDDEGESVSEWNGLLSELFSYHYREYRVRLVDYVLLE